MDVGSGRLPWGRTGPPEEPLARLPGLSQCSLFARPGTSRLLTSGTPPSTADGARRLRTGFLGLGTVWGWVGFGLSVSLSGFFVATVLLMFPFLFGEFVVGGVVSFVRLLVLILLFHRTASHSLPECVQLVSKQ